MENLEFKINGDASGLKKALLESTQGTDKLKESIKSAAEAFGLMYVAEKGLELIKDTLKESFNAFEKNETAAWKLANAIGENGGASTAMEEFRKINDELADKGIFSETELMRVEAMGLQLGLTTDQVQKLVPAVGDLAAAITKPGEDAFAQLDSMQKEVDKFIKTGHSRVLEQQLGIKAGKKGDIAGNSKLVEGLANRGDIKGKNEEAALKTTEGRMKNLNNALEHFKEKFGDLIAKLFIEAEPYLKSMVKTFDGWVDKIKEGYEWAKDNKVMLKEMATVVEFTLVPVLAAMAISAVADFIAIGIAAAAAWATATLGISALVTAVGVGIVYMWNKVDWFKAGIIGIGAVMKDVGMSYIDIWLAIGSTIETVIKKIAHPSSHMDFSDAENFIKDAADRMNNVVSGKSFNVAYDTSMAKSKKDQEDAHDKEVIAAMDARQKKKEADAAAAKANANKNANQNDGSVESETTRESITLNITKLFDTLEIKTTTLTESVDEIKEKIAQALQQAVLAVRYTN